MIKINYLTCENCYCNIDGLSFYNKMFFFKNFKFENITYDAETNKIFKMFRTELYNCNKIGNFDRTRCWSRCSVKMKLKFKYIEKFQHVFDYGSLFG